MRKETYILFTAGRGSIECALAVQGIQKKFKSFLESKKIEYDIVNQKKAELNKSLETIVFKVSISDHAVIEPWLGTILWICKSPIRRYSKRKNWYIKCEEIVIPKKVELCTKNVIVQSYKASGPGGQHRNKVETAIRIIHKSSGIIVTASDGKSQSQNKKKAWVKLEAMLKGQNKILLQDFNTSQWTTQIIIERGSPVKTFVGLKFSI